MFGSKEASEDKLKKMVENVKIAAVTSLGEVGDDHVTALIRQLAVKTPADQTELKAAITKALEKIVERA